MSLEDHNNTIAKAEVAVQENPNGFDLHITLGIAYFEAEQFNEALVIFQKASVINPDAYAAFTWIGRVYENQGNAQLAIEANEHAITLDPQAIAPYVGLGIVFFDLLFDYEAAVGAFQTGLAHHPDDTFALGLLGVTYARMERFDEAITSLQQAISLQPDNTFAYSNLSTVYLYLKKYEDVIAGCEREIEITDGHDARRMLGIAYFQIGLHDKAIQELEQAIKLNSLDYEARAALARVYNTVSRQQDAEEQYTLASKLASQDNEYGQACFEAISGNLNKALTLLETALSKKQVQAGWARIDPDLAFINNDPRFKTLLKN